MRQQKYFTGSIMRFIGYSKQANSPYFYFIIQSLQSLLRNTAENKEVANRRKYCPLYKKHEEQKRNYLYTEQKDNRRAG